MRKQFLANFSALTACLLLFHPRAIRAAEFDQLVHIVEQQSGCERTHIPFFWLARAAVAVSRPAGTSELKLAMFEHPTIAPEDFSAIVDGALGSSWRPMIRVRSQKGEVTTIFLQENRTQAVRLLIAHRDLSDAMLMQVRLNVDRLLHFVDEHQHSNVADLR